MVDHCAWRNLMVFPRLIYSARVSRVLHLTWAPQRFSAPIVKLGPHSKDFQRRRRPVALIRLALPQRIKLFSRSHPNRAVIAYASPNRGGRDLPLIFHPCPVFLHPTLLVNIECVYAGGDSVQMMVFVIRRTPSWSSPGQDP